MGGSFTKADLLALGIYEKKKERRAANKSLEKIIDRLYSKIETDYPRISELRKLSSQSLREDVEKRRFKDYDWRPFTANEVYGGDICKNGDYYISMLGSTVISKMLQDEIEPLLNERIIDRIESYTMLVYKKIPHLFDYANNEDEEDAIGEVWSKNYRGKIIPLDAVLDGKLPVVCLEKALILSGILNADKDIIRLGGKALVDNGFRMDRGHEFGSHSWVRLVFRRTSPGDSIYNIEYICDPAINEVFIYNRSSASTLPRYVPDSAEDLENDGVILFRLKSQLGKLV